MVGIKETIFNRLRPYVVKGLWDYLYQAVLEEDYSGALIYMDRQYRIAAYEAIFKFVPDVKKYELFIEAYTLPDYGLVKPKIIAKIFELKPQELVERLREKADAEGYITIYRGECTGSTKVQKALSWTIDRNIAVWFANRFNPPGVGGYLYTAKADINKVVAYATDREEEEIIIQYKDIERISKERIIAQNQ